MYSKDKRCKNRGNRQIQFWYNCEIVKKVLFNLKHGRDNINRSRDRGGLELCRVERFKISKRVE